MERIQKFPKTIGDFVKVKDFSKLNNASDTENATELNDALQHAVERVDVNKSQASLTISAAALPKQIVVQGTDGNTYLVPAMLWEKPNKPTVTVSTNDGVTPTKVTVSGRDSYTRVSTSTNGKFSVTVRNNAAGGTLKYTREGSASPVTIQNNTVVLFTPSMNVHTEKVVLHFYVEYTGKKSDETVIELNFKRKLKLSFVYSPSNPGEGTDMYFSPFGTVTAKTNQASGDSKVPTWTNSKSTGTNSMTFYTDTPHTDYWFKASIPDTNASANDGWEDSDAETGEDLLIRHLHYLTITTTKPSISGISSLDDKYQPYLNYRFATTANKDLNGNDIVTSVTYKITYNNNIQNKNTNLSDAHNQNDISPTKQPISYWDTAKYVNGNSVISGHTSAPDETAPDGRTYSWKGQVASKTIECRNLMKPTVTYASIADTHNGDSSASTNNPWADGVKFTATATTQKDENGTTLTNTLYYDNPKDSNNGITLPYSSPFTISGNTGGEQTITKDTVLVQQQKATWTPSEVAKAPTADVKYNRPHVYYGLWQRSNTTLTASDSENSTKVEQFFNGLNAQGLTQILETSNVGKYHIVKTSGTQPLLFKDKKVSYEPHVSAPIVAYPSSWGRMGTVSNGSVDYLDYSEVTITMRGVSYNVIYKNNLKGGVTEGINFTLI